MQTIIVTGASGFIGSHLILKLSKKYKLRCLVREKTKTIEDENIEYISIDFHNPVFNNELFRDVFAVIHMISIKDSNDPFIFNINVEFTRRLIQISKHNNIYKFIYLSSETVQLPSIDHYALSKVKAEREVCRYSNYLILRPTVVYGRGDQSNIGILMQSIKRFPIVPIIGAGEKLLQPTYVGDLVKCVLAGLQNDISGIHLIAGSTPIKYVEIVRIIAKELNKRILILHIPFYIAYLIAEIFRISKLSILQKSQIDNLKYDRVYLNQNTEEIFGIRLTNPHEGIRGLIND